MKRGLYRIRGGDGRPDDVRVDDDGIEMPIPEPHYRARGYAPPIEDLPWQQDYLAGQSAAEADGSAAAAAEKAAGIQARQEFLARVRKP